jgi:hypothetical protein
LYTSTLSKEYSADVVKVVAMGKQELNDLLAAAHFHEGEGSGTPERGRSNCENGKLTKQYQPAT